MKKIQIVRGGCGIEYRDEHGKVRYMLKTSEDGPFDCPEEAAARLVSLEVAAYVKEPQEENRREYLAAEEDGVFAPGYLPQPEEVEDGEGAIRQGVSEEEKLRGMKMKELEMVARSMNLNVEGCKKKEDYIRLILGASRKEKEGDEEEEEPPVLEGGGSGMSMGFKQQAAADIAEVFLDPEEFGELHRIDGKPMTVIVDGLEVVERGKKQSEKGRIDGIYKKQVLLYVSRKEMGSLPAIGRQLQLDHSKYLVMDAIDEGGIFSITLGGGEIMTGIHLELDKNQIQQVIQAMRNVEKSEESVFKTAINTTAGKAQKIMARKANQVYAGEAPQGILERSSIKKATVSSLGVTILFRSPQPDITKFRVSKSGKSPTPVVFYKRSHKRRAFPISVQQLKGAPMEKLVGENGMAFAIRFSNGKLAIVMRTGKKTGTGKDQLKTVMGSSDRSMVRNEKVYGAVQGEIAELLNQQCQKALEKALAGGKG